MAVQKAEFQYDVRDSSKFIRFKDEHGNPMTEADALPMEAPMASSPPRASEYTINGWIYLYSVQGGGSSSTDYVRDIVTPDTLKIYPYMTDWFADGFDYALLEYSAHMKPWWWRFTYGKDHPLEAVQYKGERENEKMIADGWEQIAVRASADYGSKDLWDIVFTMPEEIIKNRIEASHYFFRHKRQR